MRLKRSKSELRLLASAVAYQRLAHRASTSPQQRERYERKAEVLRRQADAINERRQRQ